MLLGIDPGADLGWGLFDAQGRLMACGLGNPPLPSKALDTVVVERPRIYPGSKQQARPEDIITLALRAGEEAGPYRKQGSRIRYVHPNEWKGGAIDKDIHHARIWAKLDDAERAVVIAAARKVAEGKRHNIMDGVGIGLYGVGRQV